MVVNLPVQIKMRMLTSYTSSLIMMGLFAILYVALCYGNLEIQQMSPEEMDQEKVRSAKVKKLNAYAGLGATAMAAFARWYLDKTSAFVTFFVFPSFNKPGSWIGRTCVAVGIGFLGCYALHSVSVQPSFSIEFGILDSDLVDGSSLNASNSTGTQQWENTPGNPVSNTILKTILAPESERFGRVCSATFTNAQYQLESDAASSIMLSYGFERRDWMAAVQPSDWQVNGSVEYVLSEAPSSGVTLPFNISIAAGLLMAGVHVASFLYNASGGSNYTNMSAPLQTFVDTAKHWSTSASGASIESYLAASTAFLLDLDSAIELPHSVVSEMTVNYSRSVLDPFTYADAVTLDIPYDDTVATSKITYAWDSASNDLNTTYSANPGTGIYEFQVGGECGPTTCASRALGFFTPEHQVQALRVCIDPATNQYTFDLLGLDGGCTLTSGGSLFLVGVGSRIESDPEITVGANPDISTQSFPSQASKYVLQKALATNVRRYRTISIVHLRWGTYDLVKSFGGKCSSTDCYGYFQYLPALQKYLVLGRDHYPTAKAAVFRNQYTAWTAMATTQTPASAINREIFVNARFADNAVLAQDSSKRLLCSTPTEKLVARKMTNHLYSGYPLQATYMAGYFFVFQSAAVHDQLVVFGERYSNAAFDGNLVTYFYSLQLPMTPGLVSLIAVLCIGVFVLYHVAYYELKPGKAIDVRDCTMTQLMEFILVDAKYPSLFLKCNVADSISESGQIGEYHDITHYTITTSTLRHNKGKGKIIHLPGNKIAIASGEPEGVTPVKLSQVSAMVDATE